MLPGVERVADAESVREAWEHPDLFASELVILEHSVDGGSEFIGAVTEATSARVIVCSADAERGRGAGRAAGGRRPASCARTR